MTNDLEKLPDIFPQIFPRYIPRNHQNIDQYLLPWGFECSDGWYQLIHDLCVTIMSHCEATGDRVPQAEQVKEKFGGLRFYVDHASEGVYKIIQNFENYSYKVCETCGKPGERRIDLGWIATLCDDHYNQRKNK